jgi:hypothetical protein
MTEFHAELRARALEAVHLLRDAELSGDDYSAEMQRADLENIARIAREHGVVLAEVEELGVTAA